MPAPKLIIAHNLERYLASYELNERSYDVALEQLGHSAELRQAMHVEFSHRKPNRSSIWKRYAKYVDATDTYKHLTIFPRRIETAYRPLLEQHFGEWEHYTELTTSAFCNRTLAAMGHCALQFDQEKEQGIVRGNRRVDEALAHEYADLPETFILFQGIVQLELTK
jgi:hypothetical protein